MTNETVLKLMSSLQFHKDIFSFKDNLNLIHYIYFISLISKLELFFLFPLPTTLFILAKPQPHCSDFLELIQEHTLQFPFFFFHCSKSVAFISQYTIDSGDNLIQGAAGCHITNPKAWRFVPKM